MSLSTISEPSLISPGKSLLKKRKRLRPAAKSFPGSNSSLLTSLGTSDSLPLWSVFCQHFKQYSLKFKVGYSIFGAFLFSYLEGANEILIRVKVGNKRGETLEDLWNVTGKAPTFCWHVYHPTLIGKPYLRLFCFSLTFVLGQFWGRGSSVSAEEFCWQRNL